jgi:diphosphomevalonate decarboxylase
MDKTPTEGKLSWQSPSNIALVKYWGKHGNQLPINPSISITLRESVTRTKLFYRTGQGGLSVDFQFEGKPGHAFGERIKQYLLSQAQQYPIINELHLEISSSNTFPHSSGIASSASAFSALALCILSMVNNLDPSRKKANFFREASELARLGSGSASRSVYPGFVVWGRMADFPAYSDRFAMPIQTEVNPIFSEMQDAILIVSAGTKKVGSSAGHALMDKHPYLRARIEQANKHMTDLHSILSRGDMEAFIEIVESEALSLHGLMLASNPGFLLMKEQTYQIIEAVRSFRADTGIPVCFTLDAGPNVHLLYRLSDRKKVKAFIEGDLSGYCHEKHWIDDGMGKGPVDLEK